MSRDRAILSDLVRRGFDLRRGREAHAEGIVRVAVFLPVLRGGGTGKDRGFLRNRGSNATSSADPASAAIG
jgi:hypothetical protein